MTTAAAKKPAAEKAAKRPTRPRKVEDVTTLSLPASSMRAFKALLECASKDTARPLLTTIEVTVKQGRAEAIATDSYRMGIARFDAGGCADGTVLVPRDLIVKALRLFTFAALEKSEEPIVFTQTGDSLGFQLPAVTFTTEAVTGTFPNCRDLYEPTFKDEGSSLDVGALAFNPRYLSTLGACIKAMAPKAWTAPVIPYLFGKSRPARFELRVPREVGIEFHYLLMPVRIS